jgi:membrane-associated phospholipid phosphatase
MTRFANIVSIVFHPLLMMTYGVLLAVSFTHLAMFPIALKLYMLGGVLLCTVFIPSFVVILMVRKGDAVDMELTEKSERVIPYMVFMLGNLLCFWFYMRLQLPAWLLSMFIGVSFALLLALCINFIWKISAHTIALGGMLGAIMGISYVRMINPYDMFVLVLLAGGLTGTARIILGKHTLMQVICGFILGFACTFLSSLLNISYLFIK